MIADRSLLDAALIGFQHQRDQIEAKIAEIRRELGGKATGSAPATTPPPATMEPKKRVMSAAARSRIGAAQRKRWAAFKARPAPTTKKRKLSAAGRKRIIAATKKRWAEFHAKKAASKPGRKETTA